MSTQGGEDSAVDQHDTGQSRRISHDSEIGQDGDPYETLRRAARAEHDRHEQDGSAQKGNE